MKNEEIEDYSHVVPKNCSRCRGPISLDRLDALPNTPFCVRCVDGAAPQTVSNVGVVVHSVSCQNGFAKSSDGGLDY